jgi:gamma-glutamyltranspeptidase / glutathione hydrolase
MKSRDIVVTALILACSSLGGRAQEPQEQAAKGPVVGRSVVATTFGIVAASQPLAARAGVQILERGGNAIDAAIAANARSG